MNLASLLKFRKTKTYWWTIIYKISWMDCEASYVEQTKRK